MVYHRSCMVYSMLLLLLLLILDDDNRTINDENRCIKDDNHSINDDNAKLVTMIYQICMHDTPNINDDIPDMYAYHKYV